LPIFNTHLWLFLGAVLLICLAPGPNVFMTVSFALNRGFGAALRAVLGTAVASLTFLGLSALGLIAVLVASPAAFSFIRIAGAVYLVYLGLRMLLAAVRHKLESGSRHRMSGTIDPFLQGLVTHLSNPKAILYWTAMLPQFIDPSRPAARQIEFLGVLGMLIDVAVLTGYAALAASTRRSLAQSNAARTLDCLGAAFFLLAGVWLIGAWLR
jgi:homoserine/homoserine lactone efflux protein